MTTQYNEKLMKNPFRVLSQSVSISSVSFKEKSFIVFTEISLIPLLPGLTKVALNVGRNCLLPNEENSLGRITVNDIESNYYRKELQPSTTLLSSKTLSNLKAAHDEALNELEGDLIIEIPDECLPSMEDLIVLRIGIDCKVVKPKAGLHFVTHFLEDEVDSSSHLFTYRSQVLSSTHEWLPCIDLPDQLALWNFDITVEKAFTVICSGDLIDTEMLPDMLEKTYHYQLLIPTSAMNIGMAIGHFQPFVLPEMSEITCFALPGLMPLLKHTVPIIGKIFEVFEELLSCRFPYNSYKQVFVDQIPEEVNSFASLSIMSINMLYHKKIIDVVPTTRQKLAFAIAQQFFSCFISPFEWKDAWLVRSLAGFLTGLYTEKHFGASEYLYLINQLCKDVCNYEEIWGKLVMYPKKLDSYSHLHFNPNNAFTCSPLYAETMYKKGNFLIRVLLKRLGKEPFFKVLHRILNVAMQFSQDHEQPSEWSHMILSVEGFFNTITNVTGRELPSFIEQWIHTGGHADFELNYSFNRKRNIIEMEISQNHVNLPGKQSYVGPLTIVVQELDGSFPHTVQIDGNLSKHDLPCHSKGRRQKRKRVPLSTGEEVEIDLTNMDPDSPIMWIRVDPEMMLIRKVTIGQMTQQLEYMLMYERDVVSQIEAMETLQGFPNTQTLNLLQEVIENDKFYFRVRCQASESIVEVQNKMVVQQPLVASQNILMRLFQGYYGCRSAPYIPSSNNFVVTSSNLQSYMLIKKIPQSMGKLRSSTRQCPTDVIQFLLGLLKYNDNSINRYSDDFYRAALIEALSNTITTAELLGNEPLPDTLTPEALNILTEFTHALNMDILKPSYTRVVAAQCIEAIAVLRLKCSSSLIKLLFETKKTQSIGVIHLIELVLEDSNPHVRYGIVRNLCDQLVQFVYNSDTLKLLNVPTILSKIWNAIIDYSLEPNIRNYLVDFYHLLSFVNNPPLRRPSQLTQSATSTLSNFQHQDWNPLNNPTLVPSTSFNPPGMTMPFSNIPPQMLISAPNGGLSNIVPSTLANDGYNLPILGGWRNSNVSQNSGQDSIMADDTLD